MPQSVCGKTDILKWIKTGLITLTDSGMEIAAKMLQRHHTLTNFLVELGVDPVTAEEDACKMEHDISDQTFKAICDHARKRMASADETAET